MSYFAEEETILCLKPSFRNKVNDTHKIFDFGSKTMD